MFANLQRAGPLPRAHPERSSPATSRRATADRCSASSGRSSTRCCCSSSTRSSSPSCCPGTHPPRSSPTRSSCSAASCRGRGSPRRCSSRPTSSSSGGNLIKKVLFPAEVLPIVTVLANMVHFLLGLPILAGFLIYYRASARSTGAAVVPGDRPRAAAADGGPGAARVGADRALPRPEGPARQPAHALVLRDADHLPDAGGASRGSRRLLEHEPDHAPGDLRIRRCCSTTGRSATGSGCSPWPSRRLACSWSATSSSIGCGTRSRRKCSEPLQMPRSKPSTSRRSTGATRTSASSPRSRARWSRAASSATSSRKIRSRRSKACRFSVPAGCTYGIIGRNGSGKSTMLKCVAGITRPDDGTVTVRRAHLGAHRARRRLPPRDLGPRERLHQRHHARPDRSARSRGASTRSSSSPSSRTSSTRR